LSLEDLVDGEKCPYDGGVKATCHADGVPDARPRSSSGEGRDRGEAAVVPGALNIRSATADDVTALAEVYRRASMANEGDRPLYAEHPELLDWPGAGAREGRTRVAIVDGRPVGFATLSFADARADLEDLFVDPDWMRRGIGRALVEDIADIAQLAGWEVIEVDANPHALAFYTDVGFTVLGEVAVEYGTGTRMRRHTMPNEGTGAGHQDPAGRPAS